MLDRHTTVHNATVCVNFVEKDVFAFFNYLFFDTLQLLFTLPNILGGGGGGDGSQAPSAPAVIAGFHCHAIKIKIENHSMNEVCAAFRTRVI